MSEPDPADPIDRNVLATQTAGDTALARDLLLLFRDQAAALRPVLAGVATADRLAVAAAAHRLKGSALAIGANRLATEAGLFETALAGGADSELANAHRAPLIALFDTTCDFAAELLAEP